MCSCFSVLWVQNRKNSKSNSTKGIQGYSGAHRSFPLARPHVCRSVWFLPLFTLLELAFFIFPSLAIWVGVVTCALLASVYEKYVCIHTQTDRAVHGILHVSKQKPQLWSTKKTNFQRADGISVNYRWEGMDGFGYVGDDQYETMPVAPTPSRLSGYFFG